MSTDEAEIAEISGVSEEQDVRAPGLTPIWDSMNEFELMRGALEETVGRLNRHTSLDHTTADDVIDVAVMTIRLTELVEQHQRAVEKSLETLAEILGVQVLTNGMTTQAIGDLRDVVDHHEVRINGLVDSHGF